MKLVESLAFALLLTVLVEGFVVLGYAGSKELAKKSISCNLITNPAINLLVAFLGLFLSGVSLIMLTLLFECVVVFVEMRLYGIFMKTDYKKYLSLSVLANVSSFCVGWLFVLIVD